MASAEVLRRDPSISPARRLLARIYIRSLGETRQASDQQSLMQLAIEQLNEILQRDPRRQIPHCGWRAWNG